LIYQLVVNGCSYMELYASGGGHHQKLNEYLINYIKEHTIA
jgi:hypothetical protein